MQVWKALFQVCSVSNEIRDLKKKLWKLIATHKISFLVSIRVVSGTSQSLGFKSAKIKRVRKIVSPGYGKGIHVVM